MADDEPEYIELVPDNILRQARERLDQIAPAPTCPICGSTHWRWEAKGSGLLSEIAPAYLIKDPTKVWEGMPSAAALMYSCNHCGFIRLHNIAILSGGGKHG